MDLVNINQFHRLPCRYSDRKLIVQDRLPIYIKIRPRWGIDMLFVALISVLVVSKGNSIIGLIATVVLGYGLLILYTRHQLSIVLRASHKLVGQFKILGKRSFRGSCVVETMKQDFSIPSASYEVVEKGDFVRLSKFENGRIFNVEVITC